MNAALAETSPGAPVARQRVLLAVVAACCVAALAAVLYLFDPADGGFFPPCVFHSVTGLHCPGCGSTRAAHQLLHGRLGDAFGFNALMVLALPVICYAGISWLLEALGRRSLPGFLVPAIWIRALFALIVVFTILRNIPLQPFRWLAP